MSIKSTLRIAILAILLLATTAFAQSLRDQMDNPNFHVYSVIFGITIDANSKMRSFRVVKVVEPSSGSTAAVNVSVPQAYVDAARRKVEAMHYPPTVENGRTVEVFTYFMFTPGHPNTVITDIYKSIDQQSALQ